LQDGNTPLLSAIQIGATSIAQLLVERGANIDAANKVIFHQYTQAVRYLIELLSCLMITTVFTCWVSQAGQCRTVRLRAGQRYLGYLAY
jgi:hypothetical protein